jgi:hypothetical protein
MKKVGVLIATLVIGSNANAAFHGVSHHSRANCINNESISWDGDEAHWFWVNSTHVDTRRGTVVCAMSSNWINTWRNAMVHYGEGRGGWVVIGEHWMFDDKKQPKQMQYEMVKDCSIYNGWWG